MAKIEPDFSYSDAELLALVKEAIAKLFVGGQTYTIGSRSFTRADLAELNSMKANLERSVAQTQNSAGVVVHSFDSWGH